MDCYLIQGPSNSGKTHNMKLKDGVYCSCRTLFSERLLFRTIAHEFGVKDLNVDQVHLFIESLQKLKQKHRTLILDDADFLHEDLVHVFFKLREKTRRNFTVYFISNHGWGSKFSFLPIPVIQFPALTIEQMISIINPLDSKNAEMIHQFTRHTSISMQNLKRLIDLVPHNAKGNGLLIAQTLKNLYEPKCINYFEESLPDSALYLAVAGYIATNRQKKKQKSFSIKKLFEIYASINEEEVFFDSDLEYMIGTLLESRYFCCSNQKYKCLLSLKNATLISRKLGLDLLQALE